MPTSSLAFEHDPNSVAARIERLYGAVFDREADAPGLDYFTSLASHGVSLASIAQSFLSSTEFTTAHPTPLTNSQFVELLYVNALGRDPLVSGQDTAGFQGWVDALDRGVSRGDVTVGIGESAEHTQIQQPLYDAGLPIYSNAGTISELYHTLLGRAADQGGLQSWTNLLANGGTIEQVAAGIAGSAEFQMEHGTLSDTDFIQLLYQGALGRAAEPEGLQNWLDALAHGATRGQVAAAIGTGGEADQHLSPVLAADFPPPVTGPTISAPAASGTEDGSVPLSVTATAPSGGTLVSIGVSGVPNGAALNHGTDNGGGNWSLTAADLSGLAVTTATDYSGSFTLTVSATSHDQASNTDNQTVQPLVVTVAPVSDTPTLSVVGTASGDEDTAIALTVSAAQTDTDGSETLSVHITNVPTGAGFNHGAANMDGSWTIAAADLPGLTFTPAPNASDAVTLHVTAVSQDGSAAPAASAVQDIVVTVNPVSDVPVVTVLAASGNEDTAIPLAITAVSADTDGSETVTVTISDVPTNAVLSAGTDNGGGNWTLTEQQLSGLTITPPPNSDADFTLHVAATSQDGSAAPATGTTQDLVVTVNPVSDTPSLTLNGTATGSEDTAIPLAIAASLTDADGSETLAITISGVPTNASLSVGTHNSDGTWTLTAGQLSGLTFTPVPNASGQTTLHVTATATDGSAAPASVTRDIVVTVNAVTDPPTLTLTPTAAGNEDTAIPLTIAAATADTDGSETVSVTISNVPTDAILNHGVDNHDGSWTVDDQQLSSLTITPPHNSDADFTLYVTATAQDGTASPVTSTSQDIVVTVNAVSDAPAVTLPSTAPSGDAGTTIQIGFTVALTDTDGSETLTDVQIIGVPDAFTLNHGTKSDDTGVWTVAASDTASLTMTSTDPTAFNPDNPLVPLTVVAGSIETGTGTPATTTTILNVTVTQPANVLSSQVIDGYISGATVFADHDGDGILDNGEISAITRADGSFTLVNADPNDPLVMTGGTDISTGLAFTGKLTAVGGSSVVTPLTTLVQAIVQSSSQTSSPISAADAEAAVKSALGISSAVVLSSFDPVSATASGDPNGAAVLAAGIQVQATVTQVTAAGSNTANTSGGSALSSDAVVGALANAISSAATANSQVHLGDASTIQSVASSSGLTSDASTGLSTVTAAANASIATAATTAATDTTTLLTNVAKAATTAINDTSAAVASTTFSDPSQTSNLNAQYTGSNLNDKVATADVGIVTPPVVGTIGNDAIDKHAETADLVISGLDGDDMLTGGAGNDKIYGGPGKDALIGQAGDNLLDGGAGADKAVYTNAATAISVDMAAGTVTRSSGGTDTLVSIEAVKGTAQDDTFTAAGYTATTHLSDGQTVNDQGSFVEFEGLGGNDTFTGNGGNGNTRVSYLSALSGVTVNIATGAFSTASGDAAGIGIDTFVSGISAVRGSNYDDILKGTNTNGNTYEVFEGRGGNDLIDGGAGIDRARYDNDPLTGLGISVTLAPVDGNNNPLGYAVVTGRDAAATAVVGTDHLLMIESYVGSNAADVFDATGYTATSDLSAGQTTNDQGSFADFEGVGGDDVFIGNGNTRIAYSRALGAVTINMSNTTTVNGVTYTGTADSTAAGDAAGIGHDVFKNVNYVRGSNFNDTITGSGGNDTFDGLAGDDFIDGGAGNDLIRYDNATVGTVGIQVNMAAGTVTSSDATTLANIGTDTLRHIEQIRGTNVADSYDATGFGGSSTNAGSNGTANLFEGKGGNDTIIGNGATTLSFNTATSGVTVDFTAANTINGVAYTGTATGDASVGTDYFKNIGGIAGTSFNDTVRFGGVTGTFTLNGGTDTIVLVGTGSPAYTLNLNGVEVVQTATGSTANETVGLTIPGTPLSVNLGAGTDTLTLGGTTDPAFWNLSLAGVETLSTIGSGVQNVTLSSAVTGLSVDLGAGSDTLALTGDNTLTITHVETLYAGSGNNTITFNPAGETGQSLNFLSGTSTLQLGADGNYEFSLNGPATLTVQGNSTADHLTLDNMTFGPVIDLGGGTDEVTLKVSGASNFGLALVNVEKLDVFAGNTDNQSVSLTHAVNGLAVDLGGGTGDVLTLYGPDNTVTNVVSVTHVETINTLNGNNTITFDPDGQTGQSFGLGNGTNIIQLAGSGSDFEFSIIGGPTTTVQGRSGDDNLTLDNVVFNKIIDLGDGNDTLHLFGQAGVYNQVTVKNVEMVYGSSQGDEITIGASTNPTTVIGGGFSDNITGSSGEDHFRFTAITDSNFGGGGDRITGFQAGTQAGHDVFQFSSSGIPFAGGALDYIGTNAFTAGSGHAQARYESGSSQVQIDVNGDGQLDAAHDMVINLVSTTGTLSQDHFLLV